MAGKITDLTAAALADLADSGLVELVKDPSGTPTNLKTTLALVRDYCLARGYIHGLKLANNATDAVNDIDIVLGEAKDEGFTCVMTLTGTLVKRIDATWAVGTNQGGLNTGAVATNTWYEVHLIKRVDTNVVDVMFTTTANRATLPTSYTKQRRIGWIRTDGASAIRAFTQIGDYFTLTTQINDVSATATATAAAVTLTAPPNSIARCRTTGTSNANVNGPIVTSLSEIVEGNVTPADTTGIGTIGYLDITGATAGHIEIRVDGSSQIEHDSSAATGSPTFDVSTYGWIDDRGQAA